MTSSVLACKVAKPVPQLLGSVPVLSTRTAALANCQLLIAPHLHTTTVKKH